MCNFNNLKHTRQMHVLKLVYTLQKVINKFILIIIFLYVMFY